jgi:hypothetical protein
MNHFFAVEIPHPQRHGIGGTSQPRRAGVRPAAPPKEADPYGAASSSNDSAWPAPVHGETMLGRCATTDPAGSDPVPCEGERTDMTEHTRSLRQLATFFDVIDATTWHCPERRARAHLTLPANWLQRLS